MNDGLLAALAIAVTAWRRSRGQRSGDVLVNLEGHGREENAVPGADLSRTVGWFTTLFPVRIDLTGLDVVDALAGGSTAASAVKLVKETLLGLPDNGIGFGILKYLDRNEELRELPTPQISFNYLGRFAGSDPEHGEVPWLPISEVTLDEAHSGELAAASVLDINAVTTDTAHGPILRATWSFPRAFSARPKSPNWRSSGPEHWAH